MICKTVSPVDWGILWEQAPLDGEALENQHHNLKMVVADSVRAPHGPQELMIT